jgi:hypothetical protein
MTYLKRWCEWRCNWIGRCSKFQRSKEALNWIKVFGARQQITHEQTRNTANVGDATRLPKPPSLRSPAYLGPRSPSPLYTLLSSSFPAQFPLKMPHVSSNVVKPWRVLGVLQWSFDMDRSVPGEHERRDKMLRSSFTPCRRKPEIVQASSTPPPKVRFHCPYLYLSLILIIVFLAPGSSRHTGYTYYIARRRQTIDLILWTVLAIIIRISYA